MNRLYSRRGFPIALILGDDEWQAQEAQIKCLASGESRKVPLGDLVEELKQLID